MQNHALGELLPSSPGATLERILSLRCHTTTSSFLGQPLTFAHNLAVAALHIRFPEGGLASELLVNGCEIVAPLVPIL